LFCCTKCARERNGRTFVHTMRKRSKEHSQNLRPGRADGQQEPSERHYVVYCGAVSSSHRTFHPEARRIWVQPSKCLGDGAHTCLENTVREPTLGVFKRPFGESSPRTRTTIKTSRKGIKRREKGRTIACTCIARLGEDGINQRETRSSPAANN
jgi:hypothetical protein